MDFAVSADHKVELKGSEKKDKYLDIATVLKILYVTVILIVVDAPGMISKGFNGFGRLRNQRTSRDHLESSIVKIFQNAEKNP